MPFYNVIILQRYDSFLNIRKKKRMLCILEWAFSSFNSLFSVPKSLFSTLTMLVSRTCIACEPHLHCLWATLALLVSHACIACEPHLHCLRAALALLVSRACITCEPCLHCFSAIRLPVFHFTISLFRWVGWKLWSSCFIRVIGGVSFHPVLRIVFPNLPSRLHFARKSLTTGGLWWNFTLHRLSPWVSLVCENSVYSW